MIRQFMIRSGTFRRMYSHGPTVSEIYHQYNSFDKHLLSLNLANIKKPSQVDELIDEGKISDHTGAILKEELIREKESKGCKYFNISARRKMGENFCLPRNSIYNTIRN